MPHRKLLQSNISFQCSICISNWMLNWHSFLKFTNHSQSVDVGIIVGAHLVASLIAFSSLCLHLSGEDLAASEMHYHRLALSHSNPMEMLKQQTIWTKQLKEMLSLQFWTEVVSLGVRNEIRMWIWSMTLYFKKALGCVYFREV